MRAPFLLALAYLLLSRILELFLSARNERSVLGRGGRRVERDGLALLVLVHVAWMAGLVAEELAGGSLDLTPPLRAMAGGAFVLAELARFACMASLGDRWTTKVIVVDGEPSIASGPYRWLRHPNYVAVVVSVAALPLALGRPWSAAIGVPLTLLALRRRVRVEDAALRATASTTG